jgi:hypothetical protein
MILNRIVHVLEMIAGGHHNPLGAMTKYTLHNKLQLWATAEEYAIEPYGSDELPLVINRRTGEMSLRLLDPAHMALSSPTQIYGVMGILKLSTSK